MSNKDTIRVHKRENPFFSVEKNTALDDKLSPNSLGVLVYLMTKPEGWQIDKNDIMARFSFSTLSVFTKRDLDIALNELTHAGYLEN